MPAAPLHCANQRCCPSLAPAGFTEKAIKVSRPRSTQRWQRLHLAAAWAAAGAAAGLGLGCIPHAARAPRISTYARTHPPCPPAPPFRHRWSCLPRRRPAGWATTLWALSRSCWASSASPPVSALVPFQVHMSLKIRSCARCSDGRFKSPVPWASSLPLPCTAATVTPHQDPDPHTTTPLPPPKLPSTCPQPAPRPRNNHAPPPAAPPRAGIAAKVLKSMGVTLKDARVEVEKIIGRGSGFVAVEIPFTPRAKRVLELSLEEARQLGELLGRGGVCLWGRRRWGEMGWGLVLCVNVHACGGGLADGLEWGRRTAMAGGPGRPRQRRHWTPGCQKRHAAGGGSAGL